MAEVVSVLSRKGGVGKTVTAMFAAAYLAQQVRAAHRQGPEGLSLQGALFCRDNMRR